MYVKVKNGNIELYTLKQLYLDNPNVSFPENISENILADYDIYPVVLENKPITELGEIAIRDKTPKNINGAWTLGWTIEKISVTAEMIKIEANRRILEICPEWKQRNLTARAAELLSKGKDNWTPEEQSEWDNGQILWNNIKIIRQQSDILENMNPIPSDYMDDKYWQS